MENPSEITAAGRSFAQRVEAIVEDGREVRASTSAAVREAFGIIHKADESLGQMVDTVIGQALGAAAKKIDDPAADTTLREVIDGLGDGFETTAQAVELAVSEAQGKAQHFAEEDLHSAAKDLRSIGELLLETAQKTAKTLADGASDQASLLLEHAEHTANRLRPTLESAARAAADDAKGIATQVAGATAAATRQGLGALFTELGARLQDSAAPEKG